MPRIKLDAPDGPLVLTHGDGSTDRLTVKDGEATVGAERLDRVLGALPGEVITQDAASAAARD